MAQRNEIPVPEKEQPISKEKPIKKKKIDDYPYSMVTGEDVQPLYLESEPVDDKWKEREDLEKGMLQFYVRHAEGLLLGNFCADDVYLDYRLDYVVVPKTQRSAINFFFHNLWVSTKMLFRKGPFWRKRLKKKIEDCKIKTGDRNG